MKRYAYVDLLRGFAALTVLICHYRWFFARWPGDWRRDIDLPGYSFLWPAYDHGEVAVPLFWILSGFVFAIAYGRFGKALSLREFWFRRFSRLYPLHFLTLIIVAGLQMVSLHVFGVWQVYANNDLPHFVLQLFFASNWFTMESSFNGPIWSVSIEELIYFAFLIYMKRFGLNLPVAVIIAFVSFCLVQLTNLSVALCGAMFFAGVAMARLRFSLLYVGLAGLAVALVLLVLFQGQWAFTYIAAPALLATCIGLDRKASLPRQFHWFGLSTYSIYLWHMPVLIALRMTVGVVPLWVFAGIVLPLAYLSYRFFEAPMQTRLRQAVLQPRTASPRQPSASS